LFDPASIADVGLQLSYAATAGILVLAKPLTRLWSNRSCLVRHWLAESIAVVFASQTAVLPIQLIYFCQIGLMFVPANLAVTSMLGPVTILGFSSSVLSLACPPHPGAEAVAFTVCKAIDLLAALPLMAMVWIVRALASFDAAILRVGQPSAIAVVIYVLAWLLFVWALNFGRHRLIATLIFLAALVAMIWRPPLPATTIACCPDAIVIVSKDRQATIVDERQDATKANSTQRLQKLLALKGWTPARTVCFSSSDGGRSEPVEIATAELRILIGRTDSTYRPTSALLRKPTVLVAIVGSNGDNKTRAASLKGEGETLRNSLRSVHADYVVLVGAPGKIFILST
jgi:hypothetical protein